jgi:hypothetical protein
MTDHSWETKEESFDDRRRGEMIGHQEAGEPLTTRDMASGVAARRVREESREESQVTADSQSEDSKNVEARDRNRIQRPESDENVSPLFESSETETFRSRWNAIQSQFVDEPRRSVEQADELVAATMKRLAEIFAGERENLEKEWDRGEDISTEDLRIALQRYRSFFDRLLSV